MRNDTCAAIATPLGRGGIAVIRVSGPGVSEICGALRLPALEARRATYCGIHHPADGSLVDRVLATCFEAPSSYTGEHMLEIGCHGGAVAPQLVLDAVLAAGARQAEPGEFTRRAFLNGKLDLLQAEATRDLVEARAPIQQRTAILQLEGGLSRRIEQVRARMLQLQALMAYEIDFPEEDEGPAESDRILEGAAELAEGIDALLKLAPEGELVHDGALAVIAGRPNVGKSSLFNALLGSQRAIVTEVPGTTRDAIEATVSIDGLPFRLVDTAGLRESSEPVERIGIEVARRYLEHANLVILCVEAGATLSDEEEEFLDRSGYVNASGGQPALLLVRTKSDTLSRRSSRKAGRGKDRGREEIAVSALSGEGIDDLRKMLVQTVFEGLQLAGDLPLVTARRQVRALSSARDGVGEFQKARAAGAPPEIAVTHLADATLALEGMLGVVTTEEILDAVFREFCVGK